MIEILPAILEKSFGPIADKVERLKGITEYAHLDLADGVFVPETSWQEHERIRELGNEIKFDLHLMVAKPEQWVARWDFSNVFRMTFHYEATYDARRTLELIRRHRKQAGIALKLDTPVSAIYDILEEVDIVLIMGIEPGAQGREFDARAVGKIEELRQRNPSVTIGVDGGVSPLVASSLIAAGADVLVSGSYIWEQADIGTAIKSLGLNQ